MKKVFSFVAAIFLLFSLGLFSHNKVFAEAEKCLLTINPSTIAANYRETLTITSNGCFPAGLNYKVIALPVGMSLNQAFPSGIGQTEKDEGVIKPVWDKQPEHKDLNTIIANLKSSFSSPQISISNYLKKNRDGSPSGDWTILVCNKKNTGIFSKINALAECETVGSGTIRVGITPPTPTPTPESDQPIINPRAQSQCTFQVGKKIHLTATNIDLGKEYHWWWTEGGRGETVVPGCYPELDLCSPSSLQFTIPENETLNQQTTEKNPDGYLLCIDLEEKKCVGVNQKPPCPERIERKKREGANCIRLYFKAYNPKETGIDTSCTANNAGDITPLPKSTLPPCAQWIYSYGKDNLNSRLNGTPIPTGYKDDPDFKDRKCGEVSTAIGNISTDPFGFVKSILSVVLSLAGGIAVIFIIISGYRLMTSQGNPEAVKAAQEQLTSAIVGFLFVIFSLVILQVIGVDILRIPGFQR